MRACPSHCPKRWRSELTISSEPNSTFQCSLDGSPFADCASPDRLGPLSDGRHTFSVQATDQAGNTDPTPATDAWTIDTTRPDTKITSGPNGETANRAPTFKFESSEPDSSFRCKLDSRPVARCDSPKTYGELSLGKHVFRVDAIDRAGNADATRAKRKFTIAKP